MNVSLNRKMARRMQIAIRWLLSSAMIFAPATWAAVVKVQLSGTWSIVNDTAGVLDGSIGVGSNFVATLVYDDATTNANTGSIAAVAGTYLSAPGISDFGFTSGHYAFTLPVSEVVEIDVDHLYSGMPDEIILYAEGYVLDGPLPAGVSSGFGYVNPELQNYSDNALTGVSLTAAPWLVAAWPSTDFYLYLGINGAGANQYIELDGTIDRIIPLTLPQVIRVTASGSDFMLHGSNFLTSSYVLVASTNLTAAPLQWTPVLTNTLPGESGFSVTATNGFSPVTAAKFYRYRTP